MAIELLCRKIGMTRVFVEGGESVPVTVLEAGPNPVVQVKTPEKEGYAAVQLAFGDRPRRTASKPLAGHYDKAKVAPRRHLHESRVSPEELSGFEVGAELKADLFEAGQRVDVIGTAKGRGVQGTVRRHNFDQKRRTHGTHEGKRLPGSIGAGAFPGRVIKGKRMAGHMGDHRVTTRNVVVVRVDAERNLLLVRGSVPGHNGGIVRVRSAVASRR